MERFTGLVWEGQGLVWEGDMNQYGKAHWISSGPRCIGQVVIKAALDLTTYTRKVLLDLSGRGTGLVMGEAALTFKSLPTERFAGLVWKGT